MNKIEISLRKLNAIALHKGFDDNAVSAMSLNSNLMTLGYVMSNSLYNEVASLDKSTIARLAEDIIPALERIVGADVTYQPMYPNFPQQVADADEHELMLNAMLHYWTHGQWSPAYAALPRNYSFEPTKFRVINTTTGDAFYAILTKLLSSADSISDDDKQIVKWFYDNVKSTFYSLVPSVIPHKENMCLVAGMRLNAGGDIDDFVKTGTDVMRVYAYLSEGDVSLSEKIKFKSLPKKMRRKLTKVLEKVLDDEDLKRRPNEWTRMAHSLHVGDFSKSIWERINKVRENSKRKEIVSFASQVEAHISACNYTAALTLLKTRPGEFARKISELVDKSQLYYVIASEFEQVVDQVPTRILLQLLGYLNARDETAQNMYVMPKGSTQKAIVIEKVKDAWSDDAISAFRRPIQKSLINRFSDMPSLGKVYVDPALKGCPVPTQMRSASSSLKMLARGSRVPFGDDKSTLRFFIYWIGQDLDLSATFHDEKFNATKHVSYTNLRDAATKTYHSGDITYAPAPDGASEFIDIDVEAALADGNRYVIMNVLVFEGPNFDEHEVCNAGWMTRDKPGSNEIYDPKTVEQKSALTSASRNAIPVIFDLKTREAIWVDIATKNSVGSRYNASRLGGNNVEANRATTEQMLKFFATRRNKVSLHELFSMHASGRGEIVHDSKDADCVFSFDGDITPFDVMDINAEFVTG